MLRTWRPGFKEDKEQSDALNKPSGQTYLEEKMKANCKIITQTARCNYPSLQNLWFNFKVPYIYCTTVVYAQCSCTMKGYYHHQNKQLESF